MQALLLRNLRGWYENVQASSTAMSKCGYPELIHHALGKNGAQSNDAAERGTCADGEWAIGSRPLATDFGNCG